MCNLCVVKIGKAGVFGKSRDFEKREISRCYIPSLSLRNFGLLD